MSFRPKIFEALPTNMNYYEPLCAEAFAPSRLQDSTVSESSASSRECTAAGLLSFQGLFSASGPQCVARAPGAADAVCSGVARIGLPHPGRSWGFDQRGTAASLRFRLPRR